MAHAECDVGTETIELQTAWNQKSLVKQIPGSRWDAHKKLWRLPLTWASLVIMRGVFQEDLSVGDKLATWSWDYYHKSIEPTLTLRQALEPIDDDSPEMKAIKSWRT